MYREHWYFINAVSHCLWCVGTTLSCLCGLAVLVNTLYVCSIKILLKSNSMLTWLWLHFFSFKTLMSLLRQRSFLRRTNLIVLGLIWLSSFVVSCSLLILTVVLQMNVIFKYCTKWCHWLYLIKVIPAKREVLFVKILLFFQKW